MAYSEKVLNHFDNPRNMGSFPKDDPTVGTGMVGAPECVHGNTLIATADGSRYASIQTLYENGQDIPVWSFNLHRKQFEICLARPVCSGIKTFDKITLSDGGVFYVTPTHEFLTRPDYRYHENAVLTGVESLKPFKRTVSKRGYWRIKESEFDEEYKSIYRFKFSNEHDYANCNIHHKNRNKQDDRYINLEKMSIVEHYKIHEKDRQLGALLLPDISERVIRNALAGVSERAQAADALNITTDILYDLLQRYGIGVEKRKSSAEIRQLSSSRMTLHNPYRNFTEEQRKSFASHKGSTNGRYIIIDNEQLLFSGHKIYKHTGKLTAAQWHVVAKSEGFPQNLTSRFKSWNNFKNLSMFYNHNIMGREPSVCVDMAYTLQVEHNNNYVVLSKITKNIHEGVVIKNCGDVMKLQIKVQDDVIVDAKFKTFGCLTSNSPINTPTCIKKIKDLNIGDEVLAWNGTNIVNQKIRNIIKHSVSVNDLLVVKVQRKSSRKNIKPGTFNLICTKEHIFWNTNNTPIEAQNLQPGQELYEITEHELRILTNEKVQNFIHNGMKIIAIEEVSTLNQNTLRGCERDGKKVVVYDLKLEDGAHIFFSNGVGSHNCGSAIASSSLATEWLKGKTIQEAQKIKNTDIVQELNLPPVKIHCSVLAEDAIKASIDDYKNKHVTN